MKTKTILAVLSIIAFGSNNSAFSQETTNTKEKDIFSPYWFMQGHISASCGKGTSSPKTRRTKAVLSSVHIIFKGTQAARRRMG